VLSLLFSGLNDLSSQSLLIAGASGPLMILMGFYWTSSSMPMPVLCPGEPSAGHSATGMALPVLM